jgi:hypothetical protein
MAYISQYQYYQNGGTAPQDANLGSYQYVSLYDIVNNFMLMYTGNHSLVNNEERFKILFHAKRAIQELNYDAFKEIKILELSVDDQLRFILPSDYVNWVRISIQRNGVLHPLSENIQTNWSSAYLQDNTGQILFDQDGNALSPQFSELDYARIFSIQPTIYLSATSPFNGSLGYNDNGDWYFTRGVGARFGLNTETANANPTFKINSKGGVINFSSGIQGELVVLEYVSDGMENGDDSIVTVNKLFESYVYANIEYELLNSKLGVQEYVVNRARKKKSSLLRNARIRISDIHPGRLLMNLRGGDKWIK